ncbi:cecropin-A1-like [Rhynchophorus ferrugineus]|uniref:Uncharacterized protein n=1 Tax=Rhynchophorus ferrugineus TaxID=354439 RepID=A0A834IQN2_RHYFE|nr:hypothetical protein GWI33_008589 [Rhynchophorus ferrugineus]
MKLFSVFMLVLLVSAAIFNGAEAGWLKKQLKSVEKAVRRVRDRAQENLPLVQGYVGVAAQAGLLPGR